MKRSTGWVAIAGVAVELATYAIASWVMGWPEPAALPRPRIRSRRRVVYKRVVEHVPPHEYAHPPEPVPHAAPAPPVPPAPSTPPAPVPPLPPIQTQQQAPPPAVTVSANEPPVNGSPSTPHDTPRPLPQPLLTGRPAVGAAPSQPEPPPAPPVPPPVPVPPSESAQTFEPLPWQRGRSAPPDANGTRAAATPPPPPRPPAPPPAPAAPAPTVPSFAVQSPIAPPPGPRFVAPPASELSTYLLEVAERTTQFNRAFTKAGWVTMAFYPDGAIRLADTDGGRYQGRSENALAAMKQQQGSRTFDLRIGVSPDGRMQTTFAGGLHDGETVVLETVDAPAGQGN